MKRAKTVAVIKRSCRTGDAVWTYRGPSERAAREAYASACKKEIARISHWEEIAARRQSNIARLLADCLAVIPINAVLTEQQQGAVKTLQAIGRKGLACSREFYEHIMEERRIKERDNRNYDKSK